MWSVDDLSSSGESCAVCSGSEEGHRGIAAQAPDHDKLLHFRLQRPCPCLMLRLKSRTPRSRTSCFARFLEEPLWSRLLSQRSAWRELHKLDQDRSVPWPHDITDVPVLHLPMVEKTILHTHPLHIVRLVKNCKSFVGVFCLHCISCSVCLYCTSSRPHYVLHFHIFSVLF